jgi:hypothetical protein
MPKYFEFRVALKHIDPPIWRRFLITTTATFLDLHNAIQSAFGWEDCHLWEFRSTGRGGVPIAGIPSDSDFDWGSETPDASRLKLYRHFGSDGGAKNCLYVYDFGDDWEHQVTFRKEVTDADLFNRRLLSGKRACPPEDCGSVPGYYRLVHFVETGEDEYGDEGSELGDWIGDWHPDAFDLERVSKRFDR